MLALTFHVVSESVRQQGMFKKRSAYGKTWLQWVLPLSEDVSTRIESKIKYNISFSTLSISGES